MAKQYVCKKCGSTETYKNGSCKPCQRAKQAIRNKEFANGKAAIGAANQKIRKVAAQKGEKVFEAVQPCNRCKTYIRYVCNSACHHCHYMGKREHPDDKPGSGSKAFSDRRKKT